jgi:DNA-binding XRE family transcriptional regulator
MIKITRDFSSFVEDLGGFVWAMKAVHSLKWDDMAKRCGVSTPTLFKLANHITRNPQMYTCWKILRALDHASIIRHSALEKYRGVNKPIAIKRSA